MNWAPNISGMEMIITAIACLTLGLIAGVLIGIQIGKAA
jgi:hypothetical protein